MGKDGKRITDIKAYDGSGDFIFVSYAHKDSDEVQPVVEYLLNRGYNVWFDEGIIPGKDWDAFLKEKVQTCSCFLCFISERSMSSDECLKEIVRAKESDRPLISIFLENATIPSEVEDYILKVQGIEQWRLPKDSGSALYVKLLSSELLDVCKERVEFVMQDSTLIRYNGTSSVVVIPEEVTQIGYDAFEGNADIVEIRIHKNVDRIGKFAFNNMPSLRRIEVDGDNQFFLSEDGILFNRAHNYLLRYPSAREGSEYIIPNDVMNVGISSFSGASDLKHVAIPSSVTMIGDRAFEACRELVGVDLHANIDRIRPYTFSRCSNLVGVELPSTLKMIGDGAFSGCNNLISVDIPKDVVRLGEMAFAYCTMLESAFIPTDLDSIEEYCFNECRSLKSIELGKVKRVKQYAFKNCEALKTIEFPSILERVERASFSGCSSIEHLILPDSVIFIGPYAFDRCSALKYVACGKNLKEIGEGAFKDDDMLERIAIPVHIEFVGPNAVPEGVSLEYF